MEEVRGDRGRLYILDNFIYQLNRELNGVRYYSCKNIGCLSRLVQSNGEIRTQAPHNHESEQVEIDRLNFREELRQLATSNRELTPRQIFNRVSERSVHYIDY